MKHTVSRTSTFVAYPEAECNMCEWEYPVARTTRREAKAHVRETGHQVTLTITGWDIYRPTKTRRRTTGRRRK